MTSKSITTLLILLLSLPAVVSGEKALVQRVFSESKHFADADTLQLLKETTGRSFYSFSDASERYWVICEIAETKSGSLTYVAIFDSSLTIVDFAIPQFQNKQNASLASRNFVRQFKKERPVKRPIRTGYGVDAISGATSSTNSLIEAVNNAAQLLQGIITPQ